MAPIRVGVLRGGISHEYDVSLQTGGSILRYLPEDYKARDILIDKSGLWHLDGLPVGPEQLGRNVDVIFNALHGEYGEDGQVQNLLDNLNIPYTGSGHLASAVGMNKSLAKEHFRRAGLKVASGFVIDQGQDLSEVVRLIFQKVSPPWVVKPADGGSSVGLTLAKTPEQLAKAIEDSLRYSQHVLVEEFILGREATVGVIDNFRDEEHYVLLPIEIVRPQGENSVWGYEDKYSGETQEICPGHFSEAEKQELMIAAKLAHRAIGARHYSRSDFILSPRGIYILEINTLPGMTENSLLPKSLAAVGCPYPHFLDHLLKLALKSR